MEVCSSVGKTEEAAGETLTRHFYATTRRDFASPSFSPWPQSMIETL